MFTERLNELLEIIGAGNKDIAKYGGFDRTNLSRLRSGTRRPGRLSPTVDKLVSGIYLFSDDRNALKELCDVIGQDPDASAPQIRQRIADWLFEGEPEDTADTEKAAVKSAAAEKKKKQQASLRSLAERLDSSMTLAELSNVRLSHLVHTDASLISRYRNGMRSPLSNPVIAEQISHILLHRILRSGKEKELAALMRLQDGKPEEGNFTAWLFQTEELPERNIHIAEDMLGFFDSYTAGSRIQLPPWESVAQGLDPADARGAYFGTEGLREAVLRFLTNAVKNRVSNLFLYSDEDQSWMTGDPAFLAAWASLMSTCVGNGTQIRIIHNIDRNLSEMNDAIRSWLPLYMSGMIESFSCERQREHRFSHTIFLAPGSACIWAFHAAGSESEGLYHYETDPASLSMCETQYRSLLASSDPLLKAMPARPYDGSSDLTVIQKELSAATMPEELIRSFDEPALTAYWKEARAAFLRRLSEDQVKVRECIPLASADAFTEGKVFTESIPGRGALACTPQQYAMHLRGIIRLLEEFPNYRIYLLPETPFPNIRLFISQTRAQIIHALRPELSFGFSHPQLCAAFLGFADNLADQTKTDRNSLRRCLEAAAAELSGDDH